MTVPTSPSPCSHQHSDPMLRSIGCVVVRAVDRLRLGDSSLCSIIAFARFLRRLLRSDVRWVICLSSPSRVHCRHTDFALPPPIPHDHTSCLINSDSYVNLSAGVPDHGCQRSTMDGKSSSILREGVFLMFTGRLAASDRAFEAAEPIA